MAYADLVLKDDPRLGHGYVTFRGASGEMRAYLANPKDAARSPAVIVVHENRGLNAHIEDVARRHPAPRLFVLPRQRPRRRAAAR